MNVVSVRGGKVHSATPSMEDPFPLCRTGGSDSAGTSYHLTPALVTCKTCLAYAERQAIAEAHEEALFLHELWTERAELAEATKFERAYNAAADANDCAECLADAQTNADDTAVERGFAEYSEQWYEIAAAGIGVTHEMHAPSEEEPPMPEAKPTTSAASTRHVRRNLSRETSHMTEAWESFSLASLEEFTEDAKRWLSDATELSSRTIDSADYEAIFTELSNQHNTESDDTMAATKKATPKVDVNTEEGLAALEEIDAKTHDVANAARRGEDTSEAVQAVEDLISALSGKGVAGKKATKRKALREAADTPVTAPDVATYAQFEGAEARVAHAVEVAREAVEVGRNAGTMAERLSEEMLELRLTIINPQTGLPDITVDSQYTKNAAADVYQAVLDGIAEDDDERIEAHRSLKTAVGNRSTATLTRWLRALDGFPEDAESQAARLDLLRQHFPTVAAAVESDPETSATEAVYALYSDKGVELPRKSRVEIQREKRRAERVKGLRVELEAAQDDGEEAKAEALAAKVSELEEGLPAELLAPKEGEKTRQERQFERIDKQREVLGSMLRTRPKSVDERNDLAAKLEAYSGWLASQAAALRED